MTNQKSNWDLCDHGKITVIVYYICVYMCLYDAYMSDDETK